LCRCKRKAASQGEERVVGRSDGGKADGVEEVRRSTGVKLYNYPD